MYIKESVEIGGKTLTIETGKMAKQADGSVVVRYGDTMVLVTAGRRRSAREASTSSRSPSSTSRRRRRRQDPGRLLQARRPPDRRRRSSTCRLIDRPSRPLFPEGWRIDTQVIATVLSLRQGEPDRRARAHRRVVRAAHLRHPVGRPVRRRPRRPHRRRVRRQPDLRSSARSRDIDLVVAAHAATRS